MTHQWPRRAYGKLVQSPGGPIKGLDYTTTARSAEPPFPSVGDAVAFQALGITSQEKWAEYPLAWRGGGLYLRPQAADGMVYMVASRARAYPEYPEKPNSREYVETIHAAHPIASLDFPSLFQLPERLTPVSLVEKDSNFAPLVLDGGREVALPPGWFEGSRAMLVALVDGVTLDSHDYSASPEEFFRRALRAVACLPGTIRWRVAIASGVYAVPQANKAGVRYAIALSFRPRETAGPAADAAGEAYARWIEGAIAAPAACETVRDLLDLVARKFPDLAAWDARPPGEGWEDAVRVLAEMQQLEILRVWYRIPGADAPRPSGFHFHHLRGDVLDLVAGSLDGPEAAKDPLLKDVIGPDWKPAWQRYATPGAEPSRMTIAGQLLGPLTTLDPAAVARVLGRGPIDLPIELHHQIQTKLSSAFAATSTAGGAEARAWEGLLRRAFAAEASPAWFEGWVKANAGKILWRAVRLRFADPPIDVTGSWDPARFPGAPAAVLGLLKGMAPEESAFNALLNTMPAADNPAVRALVVSIGAALPRQALRLALAAGLEDWLSASLDPGAAEMKPAAWLRAVADEAGAHPQSDRRLDVFLLSAWRRLNPDDRQALRSRVRRAFGPLDSILFDEAPGASGRGDVADWAWPIARGLCEADAARAKAVLAAACREPDLVTAAFREHLLGPILALGDIEILAEGLCQTLTFAVAVRKGRAQDYPLSRGRELEVARLWLPLIGGSRGPTMRAPELRRLDQLPIAALYGFLKPSPPPATALFWREWFAMASTALGDEYFRYLTDAGAEREPLWRFAAGWSRIGELSKREIDLIIRLGLVEDYLLAVLKGAPMPVEISRKHLDCQVISNVCRTPNQCRRLHECCQQLEDNWSAVEFWKCCLERMSDGDLKRLHREVRSSWLAKGIHKLSTRMFSHDEAGRGWHGLALEIYESSSEKVRKRLAEAIQERDG